MAPGALRLRPKHRLASVNLREGVLSHGGLIGLCLAEPACGLVVTVTRLSRLQPYVLLNKLRAFLVGLLVQWQVAHCLRGNDGPSPARRCLDTPRRHNVVHEIIRLRCEPLERLRLWLEAACALSVLACRLRTEAPVETYR